MKTLITCGRGLAIALMIGLLAPNVNAGGATIIKHKCPKIKTGGKCHHPSHKPKVKKPKNPNPDCPTDCDRITGGGWICETPGGEKATLAVSGGIRRGAPVGHLNYVDHGTGMHVRSTSVVSYSAVDALVRQIVYNVSIDGQAGTATVLVADLGEPGDDDLFDITLSNGYHAVGDLGGDESGGGNIQLHTCPHGSAR